MKRNAPSNGERTLLSHIIDAFVSNHLREMLHKPTNYLGFKEEDASCSGSSSSVADVPRCCYYYDMKQIIRCESKQEQLVTKHTKNNKNNNNKNKKNMTSRHIIMSMCVCMCTKK